MILIVYFIFSILTCFLNPTAVQYCEQNMLWLILMFSFLLDRGRKSNVTYFIISDPLLHIIERAACKRFQSVPDFLIWPKSQGLVGLKLQKWISSTLVPLSKKLLDVPFLCCTMENSTNNFIFGTAKLEKFSIYNNVWGP